MAWLNGHADRAKNSVNGQSTNPPVNTDMFRSRKENHKPLQVPKPFFPKVCLRARGPPPTPRSPYQLWLVSGKVPNGCLLVTTSHFLAHASQRIQASSVCRRYCLRPCRFWMAFSRAMLCLLCYCRKYHVWFPGRGWLDSSRGPQVWVWRRSRLGPGMA